MDDFILRYLAQILKDIKRVQKKRKVQVYHDKNGSNSYIV